jgi:hypothetical protein
MSVQPSPSEYLVIARGQWDKGLPRERIESVIDEFYAWLDRMVDEGKMKPGQRLAPEGKTVERENLITDGPFGESKEVVAGFWFILANSLDEAARIAQANPCLGCGVFMEIRPIDSQRATPGNTR